MAKSTRKKKESDVPEIVYYTPCEWMIQFDDDEPQLFAQSDDSSQSHEVVIKLQNTNHSHITFEDTIKGKKFKMWARSKQK